MGDSVTNKGRLLRLRAVARVAGLIKLRVLFPSAHALGFMLSPAHAG
jgi:hypothetical protein